MTGGLSMTTSAMPWSSIVGRDGHARRTVNDATPTGRTTGPFTRPGRRPTLAAPWTHRPRRPGRPRHRRRPGHRAGHRRALPRRRRRGRRVRPATSPTSCPDGRPLLRRRRPRRRRRSTAWSPPWSSASAGSTSSSTTPAARRHAEAATASPRFSTADRRPSTCWRRCTWPGRQRGHAGAGRGRRHRQHRHASSGLRPSPGTAAYGAAKAGLVNLTQTLAVEWAPEGAGQLRVGRADRPRRPAAPRPDAPALACGGAGTAADVAEAVGYLASPASAYVTGANLVVHGGGDARPTSGRRRRCDHCGGPITRGGPADDRQQPLAHPSPGVPSTRHVPRARTEGAATVVRWSHRPRGRSPTDSVTNPQTNRNQTHDRWRGSPPKGETNAESVHRQRCSVRSVDVRRALTTLTAVLVGASVLAIVPVGLPDAPRVRVTRPSASRSPRADRHLHRRHRHRLLPPRRRDRRRRPPLPAHRPRRQRRPPRPPSRSSATAPGTPPSSSPTASPPAPTPSRAPASPPCTRTSASSPPSPSRSPARAPPVPEREPATPASPSEIEPYPTYDGQSTCSPAAKPGMIAFRDMVMEAYPGTASYGISRDCNVGGTSEHKEGRAWDWANDATDSAGRRRVANFMRWLFRTDQYGHRHAMARRLGVMYIIWNRQIFRMYRANEGWTRLHRVQPPHRPRPRQPDPAGRQQADQLLDDAARTGRRRRHRHLLRRPPAADQGARGPSSSRPQRTSTATSSTPRSATSTATASSTSSGTARARSPSTSGGAAGAGASPWPTINAKRPLPPDGRRLRRRRPRRHPLVRARAGARTTSGSAGPTGPGTPSRRTIATRFAHSEVGDFDGDGRDDIFWYGPGDAADKLWFGRADRRFVDRDLDDRRRPTGRPTGDFDGDGRDDVLLVRPGRRRGLPLVRPPRPDLRPDRAHHRPDLEPDRR